MDYQVEILLEKHDDFTKFLNTKIREYNDEHSPYHKESRKKGSVRPLNIIVTDLQQQWIGGITAEVYWGWVEIKKFWFSQEFRGKGIGGQLLAKAEETAKQMGATKALLTTYDFQARTFYETRGYQVVGEVKDYPPGSSYFTMVKTLI
ncbi:GCN5 family acetyltransferase [Lysinibacillus sphaericus]|uniref:GNAT family N-acetyltransferase n=1 Tax=Lysinibacillus sphaericus TaxID=1421 RepID=UPI0018CF27AE|nr:GNAT family N-acetyltransferase [Lysinibacillus sphaericus]MBG9455773.1 GCN5 family acetyltransferase [Lysinibacillus sphaericus]MBG9477792.1 GCN5 family acetyltransferase [Lysinibacillus sphaericus]MBG9593251.1 GCN5 family acetyltransferase [Lysinibacillus sphaericus]